MVGNWNALLVGTQGWLLPRSAFALQGSLLTTVGGHYINLLSDLDTCNKMSTVERIIALLCS